MACLSLHALAAGLCGAGRPEDEAGTGRERARGTGDRAGVPVGEWTEGLAAMSASAESTGEELKPEIAPISSRKRATVLNGPPMKTAATTRINLTANLFVLLQNSFRTVRTLGRAGCHVPVGDLWMPPGLVAPRGFQGSPW
jgi:hypothetical protein